MYHANQWPLTLQDFQSSPWPWQIHWVNHYNNENKVDLLTVDEIDEALDKWLELVSADWSAPCVLLDSVWALTLLWDSSWTPESPEADESALLWPGLNFLFKTRIFSPLCLKKRGKKTSYMAGKLVLNKFVDSCPHFIAYQCCNHDINIPSNVYRV